MFSRYAIYYTPAPETPLARFGAAWLGWDSATGQPAPHQPAADLDLPRITETPRKYGFHGTIKPPFRLAPGTDAAALETALRAFCAAHAPVTLSALVPRALGRFVALVPDGPAPDLAQLAAAAVQTLDPFRAPPTEAELAKRRAARLSPSQEANLTRWGYPYVLDAFRFHLTLTGRLETATRQSVLGHLQAALQDMPLSPYLIDALTLLGEGPDGCFHQCHRIPLTG